MTERSETAEELRTARLWLRRPAEADIDLILGVHSDLRAQPLRRTHPA
ncbi:hypothetical protein [Streptomyces canus]